MIAIDKYQVLHEIFSFIGTGLLSYPAQYVNAQLSTSIIHMWHQGLIMK